MNSNDRMELFAAMAELAQRYPHWRLGQLIANVAGWADAEIWDAEDTQLLLAARAHLQSRDLLKAEPLSTSQPFNAPEVASEKIHS